MIQYCSYRRLLIVDEDDDLFIPFHLLMCTAIVSVLESYETTDNPFMAFNKQLLIWKRCSFTGSETWKEVRCALGSNITNLHQYIRFVMVIPRMKSFLQVIAFEQHDRYVVSLLMSLGCFVKYNLDTYCHYDLDVDICGFTAHSLASGCGRCQDNYNMLESDKNHDKACSYYLKILPFSHEVQKVRDEKAAEKELLQGAVIHMYETVIHKAEEGNGCVVLPPPKIKYLSQRKKMDSFLLCEFSNEANNKLFHVWLNKVQAVNVSMDNIFDFLIKHIMYVDLIIDMYCFNYLLFLLHI